jgi:Flp pilus assembly protein TadB
MLSPMTTVLVLVVLWLIVVVPMVLRRNDARRRDRSVAGFGRAMRALGRRPAGGTSAADADAEVYVPSKRPAPTARPSTRIATPARRPVPAVQEALMHPVDRSELSEARTQMMKRRRRSLSLLGGGTVLFGLLAVAVGGILWALAIPFLLGLVGYLWFLRSQALRDRDRRADRQRRSTERHGHVGVDLTEETVYVEAVPSSVVRIDDDDLELHNMDTIDLTGLYSEELAGEAVQRRAS